MMKLPAFGASYEAPNFLTNFCEKCLTTKAKSAIICKLSERGALKRKNTEEKGKKMKKVLDKEKTV